MIKLILLSNFSLIVDYLKASLKFSILLTHSYFNNMNKEDKNTSRLEILALKSFSFETFFTKFSYELRFLFSC